MKMTIEELLKKEISGIPESRVRDAMEYSLMAGGKRIRPVLLLTTLRGYGMEEEKGYPFACALEMIHTYSLIHDDLPAMDNDDLRRGKPTCHKAFDEATAILAGDGLLTQAFAAAAESTLDPSIVQKCICILACMAGPSGMVLGQCLDMEENSSTTWKMIQKVQYYKTGCLLSAPLMIAGVIAEQDDEIIEEWHKTGNAIGLAFQIQDDILDETETAQQLGKSNSDERNGKVTSVSLFGLQEAEKMMNDLYDESCSRIKAMRGFDSAGLIQMIGEIRSRKK